MDIFNTLIKDVEGLVGSSTPKIFKYSPDKAWETTESFELVMMKDSAYELGGDRKPAVNYSLVTSDPSLVGEDRILLYGKDLNEINGSAPYARITILYVKDIDAASEDDSEETFRAIQAIDFVKYHVFPKGYMIRTSSESNREQVRLSKRALKSGVSFEKIGNAFIREYKKNPNVVNAKVIFVTAENADYAAMTAAAKKSHDITLTLSKILEGMPTDCHSCNLKEICDEVEGMKELHFGKSKQ